VANYMTKSITYAFEVESSFRSALHEVYLVQVSQKRATIVAA
jgi:hypothetical protein